MERNSGRSSARAFANASSPHGYQSTGLWACWRRYGEVSWARRFVMQSSRGSLNHIQQLRRERPHLEVLALQLLDLEPIQPRVRQKVLAHLRVLILDDLRQQLIDV